jgi:hypothetical protein
VGARNYNETETVDYVDVVIPEAGLLIVLSTTG